MRPGLERIPSPHDLERAYADLSAAPDAHALARYAQWSRFDPRLAEIWVATVLRDWKRVHPLELREELQKQPWPTAAGPLLEFVARAVRARPADSRTFRAWKLIITEGLAPADWEQFFIGQRRIAGKAMLEDACFAADEYRRWGYLSREVLFNKQSFPADFRGSRRGRAGGGTHSIAPEVRQEILRQLMSQQRRISTSDYLESIGHCISERQATRDLRQSPWVETAGRTKGRSYVRRRGA
jgi:hypothetical protein